MQALRLIQDTLKPYEYRANLAEFWLQDSSPDADYSVFDTFVEDDLPKLKKKINTYKGNKLRNCWVERVLFDQSECPYFSHH